MKQSLPWNVTGIPAEARELARAAAAREGISVGDWLTRRILGEAAARPAEPASTAPAPLRVERMGDAKRDDSTPRQQTEAASNPQRGEDPALRRIDETLRTLARRIEAAERSQHETGRAMNAAAEEVNASTRSYAQNFTQLNERIDAVERGADGVSLRDAVKGLHQSLSRLAEQVTQATNESNNKINMLSGTIDGLSSTVAKGREDAQRLAHEAEQKVSQVAERIQRSEERLEAADARIRASEARLDSADERVQEAVGHHLTAIQRNLDGIVARLEQSERTRIDADNSVSEVLRGLNGKFESADKRTRDAMAELRAGLTELGKRLDTDAATVSAPAPTPTPAAAPATLAPPSPAPAVSLPVFDEFEEFEAVEKEEAPPPPAAQVEEFEPPPFPDPPDFPTPEIPAPPHLGGESKPSPASFVETLLPTADSPQQKDYISAARRAAQAAAEAEAQRKSRSPLAGTRGGSSATKPEAEGKTRVRVPPVAAAAVFVVTAGALGFLITSWTSPFGDSGTPIETVSVIAPPATQGQLPPVQGPQGVADAAGQTAPANLPPQPAQAAAAPNAVIGRLTARAQAGSADAALLLGLKYVDGDGVAVSDAEGVRWLTRAAGQGEALAQYRLGTLFERGRGVPQDERQAFHWYEQSAKGGNRKAMHNLAVAFAEGTGTEKNLAEAANWFRSAADLGLVDSQFNLAVLYERGMGVTTSLGEAYKWYLIAADQGDAESRSRVDAVATQLQPAQRAAAERAAEAFRAKTIDNNANEPPTLAQAAP